jgi:hypothetical protein
MSHRPADAQLGERELPAGWYVFTAACLCILTMVVLARANVPNAREIAAALGIVPHKPVTMALMTLSLAASLAFGGFAAYLLVWWDGRHRPSCLMGTVLALAVCVMLHWSAAIVRLLNG